MKRETILSFILAVVVGLEGWQLFTLYQMRDEISRLDQKLTDHIQFHATSRISQ